MTTIKTGIASIGLHFPPLAMPVEELAKLRSIDPNKFTVGLGCGQIALCPENYTAADLAVVAAERALSRWQGDRNKIAVYEEHDPGEPTQCAGAVAMIIDEPLITEIEPLSYPWSEPAFDFWRPVNRAYPLVDSKFSLDCYMRAATACMQNLIGDQNPETILRNFHAHCFHVPFPKMVKKAIYAYCQSIGWDLN